MAGGKTNSEPLSLRVVIFQDGTQWIAQALERDLCTRGPDLEKVKSRLETLVSLERDYSKAHNKTPFDGIEPAPKFFHELWDKRSGFVQEADNMQMALCA